MSEESLIGISHPQTRVFEMLDKEKSLLIGTTREFSCVTVMKVKVIRQKSTVGIVSRIRDALHQQNNFCFENA